MFSWIRIILSEVKTYIAINWIDMCSLFVLIRGNPVMMYFSDLCSTWENLCHMFQVRVISATTVWRHTSTHIFRYILSIWRTEQADLLANVQKVEVQGDARMDSPGHCAKFGTYSLLDNRTKKVIASEIVQVSMAHFMNWGNVRLKALLEVWWYD